MPCWNKREPERKKEGKIHWLRGPTDGVTSLTLQSKLRKRKKNHPLWKGVVVQAILIPTKLERLTGEKSGSNCEAEVHAENNPTLWHEQATS